MCASYLYNIYICNVCNVCVFVWARAKLQLLSLFHYSYPRAAQRLDLAAVMLLDPSASQFRISHVVTSLARELCDGPTDALALQGLADGEVRAYVGTMGSQGCEVSAYVGTVDPQTYHTRLSHARQAHRVVRAT